MCLSFSGEMTNDMSVIEGSTSLTGQFVNNPSGLNVKKGVFSNRKHVFELPKEETT